jgi:hypothetical protein
MTYNPDIHHRRSIWLKGYDYSLPGAYYVTICTQNRQWGVAPTLSDVVCRFKTLTTEKYIDGVKKMECQPFKGRLWQELLGTYCT